jgi:hypothetical protein
MPPAGFEPTIPASERPQTHALDSAATGIGIETCRTNKIMHQSELYCDVLNPDFIIRIDRNVKIAGLSLALDGIRNHMELNRIDSGSMEGSKLVGVFNEIL